jgi:hypothetical protein
MDETKTDPLSKGKLLILPHPDHSKPCISLAGANLVVKRILKSREFPTGEWTITPDDGRRPFESKESDMYAKYAEYPLVVETTLHQNHPGEFPTIKTLILVHSHALETAAKVVLKDVQKLSWNVKPFKACHHFKCSWQLTWPYRLIHNCSSPSCLVSRNTWTRVQMAC